MTSESVQRLIVSIRAHRVEGFCRSLGGEDLEWPAPNSTWTVKGFVSHLGTLDPAMAGPPRR